MIFKVRSRQRLETSSGIFGEPEIVAMPRAIDGSPANNHQLPRSPTTVASSTSQLASFNFERVSRKDMPKCDYFI